MTPSKTCILRLRQQVREHTAPYLARELARARELPRLSPADLAETWSMTLTLLFRLLCLAYARDRNLAGLGCGDLFESDPAVARIGGLLASIRLPDSVLDLVCRDLQPIDFRRLDVRALGSIYEDLLECVLTVGETGLRLDRSGARKTAGVYFTGDFLIDHLLDHALEPALKDHLARLEAVDAEAAAQRFFDFRVADIAMGTGHFLVAAVDRIERALTAALRSRPLPGVERQMDRWRAASNAKPRPPETESAALLRWLVVRNCIYGVDVDSFAVTLARLALAIHAFVPGLPPPAERNLIAADALLGEALLAGVFPEVFARKRAGFDVMLSNPPWEKPRVEEHAFWARHQPGLRSLCQRDREAAQLHLRSLRPDLIEKLQGERKQAETLRASLVNGPYPGIGKGDPDLYQAFCWRFWTLTAPDGRIGLVLPRSALVTRGSQSFRETLFAGSREVHITPLVNKRKWVFEQVHPQYTIALVAICRGQPSEKSIALAPLVSSREQLDALSPSDPARASREDVAKWTDTSALPLLPSIDSLDVLTTLRAHPRLDCNDPPSWRCRPATELHATNDKALMDLRSERRPPGYWPVYKGESFDLWTPDTGIYYAWANPEKVLPELIASQRRGARSRSSPFSELPASRIGVMELLACQRPRIAFRDVSRATDSRTMRCALIPPHVFVNHKAPYFLFPRGGARDEAYLLGVLSSLPLDWSARRFVETSLTYHVLNCFPIPRPGVNSALRERVIHLAGRLAASDDRFAKWAEEVGVGCGPLPDDQKQDHIHELDGAVALLYGLMEKQLVHIFLTFHEGWDHADRLDATLGYFRAWRRGKRSICKS